MMRWIVACVALAAAPALAKPAVTPAIEQYVAPYVDTRNFAGVIFVAKRGTPVFARAYGYADREHRTPNSLNTRFHVASMSMQFTAAAALRLVNAGKLSLDTPVSDVVPDYPSGGAITLRNLLTQTSGIADINAQDNYSKILESHQTPLSLVTSVRDLPPLRKPGTFEREEHSAYNLLALIIERKTGLPFAKAVQRLVFQPLGMRDTGIDDDSAIRGAASGYQPKGLYDLEPADRIHWSAKAGNGSAYTTAGDELKFVRGLYRADFLKPALRDTMFNLDARVGYGWFKSNSARFGQPVYSMNGRAPGFASAMVYLPQEQLFVAAFSNIYASVPADMAYDIAALALGKPYEMLGLQTRTDPASLAGLPASFKFPKDFYQSNAVVKVEAADGSALLHWPSGDSSVLIPTSKDHYIDRNYWVPVEVLRGADGKITQLKYDRFSGDALPN